MSRSQPHPHIIRSLTHSTSLAQPVRSSLTTCGGWSFTPVYAPLDEAAANSNVVAEEEDEEKYNGGIPRAHSLVRTFEHSQPYGVAIYCNRSSSDDAPDDCVAELISEELEPTYIIGGHEQEVTGITAVKIRCKRKIVRDEEAEEDEYAEDDEFAQEDDTPTSSSSTTSDDILLLTCSADRLTFWTLSSIISSLEQGISPVGRVMHGNYTEKVGWMEVSEQADNEDGDSSESSSRRLAICHSDKVSVLDIETGRIIAVLEGHTGRVNQARFVPKEFISGATTAAATSSSAASSSSSSHLLTLGQDRTFKLWDLTSRRMIYTSSIVSASPFVDIAWERNEINGGSKSKVGKCVLATQDGKVRVYEFGKLVASGQAAKITPTSQSAVVVNFRLIHTLDLDTVYRRALRIYENECLEMKRRKEKENEVVIRAKPSSATAANTTAAYEVYKPYLASEANMPSSPNDDNDSIPEMADQHQQQPISILAMYFMRRNGRTNSPLQQQQLAQPTSSPKASLVKSSTPPVAASTSSLSSSSSSDTLYICTTRCMIRLNTRTYEIEWIGGFMGGSCDGEQENVMGSGDSITSGILQPIPIGMIGMASFDDDDEESFSQPSIRITLASAFLPELSFLTLGLRNSSSSASSEGHKTSSDEENTISVYSLPLATSSILRQWQWTTTPSTSSAQSSKSPLKRGAKPGQLGAQKEHNIVFHTRIKGSGYGGSGATPNGKKPPLNLGGLNTKSNSTAGKMFQAQQKRSSGGTSSSASSSSPSTPSSEQKRYPMTTPPISTLSSHTPSSKTPPLHNAGISSLLFSPDGKKLLTCSLDSTAAVTKWPAWKQSAGTQSGYLMGHKKAVKCGSWAWKKSTASADDTLLLTGSSDCTARLWSVGRADPLLVFDRIKKSSDDVASSSTSSATAASDSNTSNPLFTSDITSCRFFRQNQLILLSHRSSLLLYKYYLDPAKTNTDLKKLQGLNKYKLLREFSIDGGGSNNAASSSIMTTSCINPFLSSLILYSDTAKNVCIYDAAQNQVVRRYQNAHERNVHCITMNASSAFSGGSTGGEIDTQQLFLTVATDSAVKLWDVRVKDCVRRYSGHVNRSAPIRASFSPCYRYIACGSEDNRAYVYDLAQGNIVDKLTGATDVVSDVVYHPLHAQIVTSAYDGRLRYYTN